MVPFSSDRAGLCCSFYIGETSELGFCPPPHVPFALLSRKDGNAPVDCKILHLRALSVHKEKGLGSGWLCFVHNVMSITELCRDLLFTEMIPLSGAATSLGLFFVCCTDIHLHERSIQRESSWFTEHNDHTTQCVRCFARPEHGTLATIPTTCSPFPHKRISPSKFYLSGNAVNAVPPCIDLCLTPHYTHFQSIFT